MTTTGRSAYERMRERMREATEEADRKARESRDRMDERARERLRATTTGTRRKVLAESVTRMSNDDLETAWVAALRGDLDVALERFRPHVRESLRERTSSGTPWRKSGWLSR